MLKIEALSGLWTRSLQCWPDGRSDTTTNVAWLQGISAYADLRQTPQVAGQFRNARCLRDLSLADCQHLATQQGFAGNFVPQGQNFEWLRRIDFQPPRATRDIGHLFWREDILVEEGLQGEYIEHWHRDPQLPATPCAALTLQSELDGVWGQLLRVGDLFMVARDRREPVTGATLAECIAAAPSLPAAQDALDFEISFGEVSSRGWRITRSTLPFRETCRFHYRVIDQTVTVADIAPDGASFVRSWRITAAEGDISMFAETEFEL